MKKCIVFILLMVLVVHTFRKAAIVLDFYANQRELAQKFCVNKQRPLLRCNGHCFLMKLLKKEEEREKNLANAFKQSDILFHSHRFPLLEADNPDTYIELPAAAIPRNIYFLQDHIVQRLLRPPISISAI